MFSFSGLCGDVFIGSAAMVQKGQATSHTGSKAWHCPHDISGAGIQDTRAGREGKKVCTYVRRNKDDETKQHVAVSDAL